MSQTSLPRPRPIGPKWVRENYTKREVMIPMRDHVKLYAAIYSPKDAAPHPVIMVRSPYNFSPYGKGFSRSLHTQHYMFLQGRYHIVYTNVRGTVLSEGQFENVRPVRTDGGVDELTDTFDTIEWLLSNLRTNGSVGIKGISYQGFYATLASLCGHPALKAVSPQAPVTDWFLGDDSHMSGAFQLPMFSFASSFMRPRLRPAIRYSKPLVAPDKDIYDWYLEREPLGELLSLLKGRIPFVTEMVQHPTYDSFWKERNASHHLESTPSTPMLCVGGWYDGEDCYGSLDTFRKKEGSPYSGDNFLCMGPWYHGGWKNTSYDRLGEVVFGKGSAKYFLEEVEYPFFSHYLEGKGEKPSYKAVVLPSGETDEKKRQSDSIPPSQWQYLSSWPPEGARRKVLYLSSQELLTGEPSLGPDEVVSQFISDPLHPVPYCSETTLRVSRDAQVGNQRFAARRTDVLTFTSPVLQEEFRALGSVVAHIRVAVSTSDADIVVKLIDVRPDGFCMLVRYGVLPLRFRESFERSVPALPGEIYDIDVPLCDIGHTFLPNHRIMVQVQGSLYPSLAMNPQRWLENPYEALSSDYVRSTVSLYGGSYIGIDTL